MNTTKNLFENSRGRVLVAAHRGVSSADIPCNTVAAYGIALMQDADIVEIDVSRSRDGQLFVFHPGMEPAHLKSEKYIKDMTAEEVSGLVYVNQDDAKTVFHVNTLDEVLSFLKGKCLINVDKFWMFPEEITQAIRKHGMADQVIVKTPVSEEQLAMMERVAPDFGYIPLVNTQDTISEMLLQRNIHYLGAEVLFASDKDPAASKKYIDWMHDKGLLVWGNSIVYDYKAVISGGHTDDGALTEDMDKHWGWFVDRGFDIMQTDWCMMLKQYLAKHK